MKLRLIFLLIISHISIAFIGFSAGIYLLPILTAPPAPSSELIQTQASKSHFQGQFVRELTDSDTLHWGEGEVFIGNRMISFQGELAPGPDYKLYLSPKFVETEAEFNQLKSNMTLVGDIKTFNNFIVTLPEGVNPADYNSVIVWCESFGQFITAAKYQ